MVHRHPIHSIVPLFFFLGLGLFPCSTTAFVAVARPGSIALVAPTTTRPFQKSRRLYNKKDNGDYNEDGTRKKNVLESILDPYPTKIPLELKDEIYAAEANTPAAQNRSTRQWIYGAGGSFCFLLGFVNVFLTELRHRNEGMTNTDMGFAAVDDNPLLHTVFATKIGGYLLLAMGAAAGFLFEAEVDSRRANAEKIWEELQRRRTERDQEMRKQSRKQKKRNPRTVPQPSKKKSGAKRKRLSALVEVMDEPAAPQQQQSPPPLPTTTTTEQAESTTTTTTTEKKQGGGIFGQLKNMYDEADRMAASQALLLNKELEELGVVDKITDETGLKVIGKDAANLLSKDDDDDDQAAAP